MHNLFSPLHFLGDHWNIDCQESIVRKVLDITRRIGQTKDKTRR